jgi:hypothetical protein
MQSIEAAGGQTVSILKHQDEEGDGLEPGIQCCKLKDSAEEGIRWQIFGATIPAAVWMFDREREFKWGTLDVLMLDEAGQILAPAAAALSRLAPRVLLFGDEDQLPPIARAPHEPGSFGDASAMEYFCAVAGKEWEIPLEVSHRMNAEICALVQRHFYPDIPLRAGTNAEACLLRGGQRQPSLRLVDCPHSSHRLSRSPEEIEVIVGLVREALGSTVMLGEEPATLEQPRPLRPDDIAILTPFRSQAAGITKALTEAGIHGITRVGTVDKLQGQGAALVIYSLAASSPDYIGAQTEWLFSPNRWNVAISRAKAQCVVVGDLAAQRRVSPQSLRGTFALSKLQEILISILNR